MQDELRELQEAALTAQKAWNGRERRQAKATIAALEKKLDEKTNGYKSARSSAQVISHP